MSFYRKYRPQKFEDVIGQEEAISILSSISKSKDIPHAYIFCGGHGIGKTTLARIFARELGTNEQDVYEMDAASNRGIDEARELREAIHTMPMYSKYKIYILDEAHMLTKEASNALLKTLEEPPKHIIFILCTTDPDKLISTIRSRCQIINFKKASSESLIKQLSIVAKSENIKIEDDAIKALSNVSNKSFRDALSNLETLSHISNKNITLDSVLHFTKSNNDKVFEIIENINDKNVTEILDILENIDVSEYFYDNLLEIVRKGMLVRQRVEIEVDNDFKDFVYANEQVFTSKTLLFLLEKKSILRFVNEKRIAMQAIISELCELK